MKLKLYFIFWATFVTLKIVYGTTAPYFTEEPEKVEAAEGETVQLHCRASGTPEPQIQWIYNGRPISEAPLNPRRKISENSIIIEKFESQDAGNYSCNATNSLGYVYKDVYVNVIANAPNIIEPPRDKETVIGHTVRMKCKVIGSPKPQIKWVRNGIELMGGRYTILKNGDLEIGTVGFEDTGDYTCCAQNKISYTTATASLSVRQRTQIINGFSPINYEVKAGDPVMFRCSARNDPELDLTINWQRNGQPIVYELEPRLVQSNDNSLIITKTTELDSGVYTCVASTRLDNNSAESFLIIQDVPNPPKFLSVRCNGFDADVTWQSMGDNRSPILNYIIQYSTSFTPNVWNVASDVVPASETTYNVPMAPWTNYTFRVLAKNKIGISLPSLDLPVCKTELDVPYKNPENVIAQGTEPNNLVVTWKPMPENEHNGDNFYYEVSWKRDIPGYQWESQRITKWEIGRYEIQNTPTFVKYIVRVTSGNSKGKAKASPKEVEGYSGEDVPTQSPSNLTLIEVLSATSANLSWNGVSEDSVRGHLGYTIKTWILDDSQKNLSKEIHFYGNITNAIFDKLIPNSRNLVRVFASNEKYESQPSNDLVIITPEGVPGTVEFLEAVPLGSSALYLMWKPPTETNGVLIGYKIYYQTVFRTELGVLQERQPQITDPTKKQVKLTGLKSRTKYRIYVSALTKAGEGKGFFIEQTTRRNIRTSIVKPDFLLFLLSSDVHRTIKIIWLPCGTNGDIACADKFMGSYFYVKYKIKGESVYETVAELYENYVILRGLKSNEVYEFIVGSVDGNYVSESDAKFL